MYRIENCFTSNSWAYDSCSMILNYGSMQVLKIYTLEHFFQFALIPKKLNFDP